MRTDHGKALALRTRKRRRSGAPRGLPKDTPVRRPWPSRPHGHLGACGLAEPWFDVRVSLRLPRAHQGKAAGGPRFPVLNLSEFVSFLTDDPRRDSSSRHRVVSTPGRAPGGPICGRPTYASGPITRVAHLHGGPLHGWPTTRAAHCTGGTLHGRATYAGGPLHGRSTYAGGPCKKAP